MKKIGCKLLSLLFLLSLAAVCVSCGEKKETEMKKTEYEGDLYGDGYQMNLLVGIDQFGRTFQTVADAKENREVGIFFFLWMGQPFGADIYNTRILLEQYGISKVLLEEDAVCPAGQPYYWDEPLWGYYNSGDEWVIRKQIELLTMADIDFLVFDTTNTLTYSSVYKRILRIIEEYRNEGWDAPQVVFYTHSRSIQTINALYQELYSQNLYPEAWYRVNGKPMIIGYDSVSKDIAEAQTRSDYEYLPAPLSEEVRNFFHIREARWPNDEVNDNTFPYTEWQYPQPMNGNMMSVSVATHPMVPFSFSLTHENWCNWGRGYNVETGENVSADILTGTFFQSQWETVFDQEPELVFVTGWNEWIAFKSAYGGEYMLCDNVDLEYSRDIEMMKGGYNDAYYIQLMQNVRKYKYDSFDGYYTAPASKTIEIGGDIGQWEDVAAVYRDVGKANVKRDSYGSSKVIRYQADPKRNNLQEVKVSFDDTYLYFMVKSDADLTEAAGENWMNLLIGTGTVASKGWEGYEYVINRNRDGNTAVIERLSADYSGTACAEAEFAVSGAVFEIKIPRSAVGLAETDAFYFKIADGVETPSDIMSYYTSGSALPMGRLSYQYYIGK